MEKAITIYTDGACSGNPGPGGWAALVMSDKGTTEIHGGEYSTTNNRMELTAVIEALKLVEEPCNVMIYSDSTYVVNSFTKGWLANWESSGSLTSDTSPTPNSDLWLKLLSLLRRENIKKYEFFWVRGHSGDPKNERCDELAHAESEKNRDILDACSGNW